MRNTEFLTSRQVCRRYGISARTLQRWVHASRFVKPLVIAGRWYFRVADIEAFEQANPEAA